MAATKNAKKRTAPTNSGIARKKQHLEKAAASEKKAHRKAPVTRIQVVAEEDSDRTDEESDDEQSEEEDWESLGSSGVEFEEIEGEEAEFEDSDENGMSVEGEAKPKSTVVQQKGSTTDARESRKAQKVLQQSRKASKQHSDVLAQAKPLWERARRKNLSPEERKKHVGELMEIVRGKVQDVVFKHDASRIIQTLVKYGNQDMRDEVARELKGRYKDLAQNKYSKFIVTKLIRILPKHRPSILFEFRGHVVRLLLHREASSVIADAYELYANAFERALLLYDFYGKEVNLFSSALKKGNIAEAGAKEKVMLKKGLKGVLEDADSERKKRVLAAVKENLELVMNNSEKGAMSHAIFHRVLWEYLSQVSELKDEALQEKLRREIFEACQEQMAEMVHTKDGSRVVREFIAQGTAKDRKQIVKVLKPHIERICNDEEAQNVLFTALDVIDDTKLTGKSLVPEMTSRAQVLYKSPQGRRALLYLLVPRVSRHFTPAQRVVLEETDPIRAKTSKKDESIRREEVLRAASPALIELLKEKERTERMLRDPGGSLVVTEIMLYAEGDKTRATETLVSLLNEPYPSPSDNMPHVIDIPHASRVYKSLLQGGHFSHATQTIIPIPEKTFSSIQFSRAWMKGVDKERTREMGLSGGTFVVAALVERVLENGEDEEKREVKRWFDEVFLKKLTESEARGKKVLLDVLGK
ncbi:PUF6 [Sanghuangporus weigelae]